LELSKVSTIEVDESSRVFAAQLELIELPTIAIDWSMVENLNLNSFYWGHFSFFLSLIV